MRRVSTYVSQQVYEWLFSAQAQYSMTALAKVCAALFGTNSYVNGLPCTPTSPATMTVQIGAGEIYQMESLEATACGTLPADTSHTLLKQGIQLGTYTTATFATPGTSGQSINYLIEAQYQDSDISLDPTTGVGPVVLQFYNSTNPSTPWSGPNNTGATSNTFRDGIVAYQIKAGVAATTGSQVTPSPDSGWVGLWVVTVAFGQSAIAAGNITQYAGAPILPSSLLASIQNGNLSYAVATGSANAHTIALTPALQARVDGMPIRYKATATNTGAVTLNDGVGTASVLGGNHSALQGGEYIANGIATVVWDSSIGGGAYILEECTGAAIQVAPATQSNHAPQMAQVAGVVGSTRNLSMVVATASASATLTADEIIVETALGGVRYCLPNFSKTINLATTGAGGMDTGTAPASGYVALYAIYNPTTGASALLATNATSAVAPNVYGGANMPSGYTASALVSVWPTSSSQFVVAMQKERSISLLGTTVLSSSTNQASFTALSIASAVPPNAVSCSIRGSVSSTSAPFNGSMNVASSNSGIGAQTVSAASPTASVALVANMADVKINVNGQTIQYNSAVSAGTPTYNLTVYEYKF